jgi:hypothetical protein
MREVEHKKLITIAEELLDCVRSDDTETALDLIDSLRSRIIDYECDYQDEISMDASIEIESNRLEEDEWRYK